MKFPTHKLIVIITKHKNKYLILRFCKNCNYCPGDWDFVNQHFDFKPKNLNQLAIKVLSYHTKLKGVITKQYQPYFWLDPEYQIQWHCYPFLIEVTNKKIKLKEDGKYNKFKWVSKNQILKYDRLEYFKNVLEKTIKGGDSNGPANE